MKVLVVGLGSIGERYVRILHKNFQVYVLDRSILRATQVATKYGVEKISELKEAEAKNISSAIVAVPNQFHLSIASELLKLEINCLIEKPLATSLHGIQKFFELVKTSGCKVNVVCNMRFHPAIEVLKNNLFMVGDIRFVESYFGNYLPNMRPGIDYRDLYCSRRKEGGGVVLDAVHEVDYLCYLLTKLQLEHSYIDKLSMLEIDVEDFALLRFKSADGVLVNLTLDYIRQFKERGCSIYGESGTLAWESWGKSPETCYVTYASSKNSRREVIFSADEIDQDDIYYKMLSAFLNETKQESSKLLNVFDAAFEVGICLRATSMQTIE